MKTILFGVGALVLLLSTTDADGRDKNDCPSVAVVMGNGTYTLRDVQQRSGIPYQEFMDFVIRCNAHTTNYDLTFGKALLVPAEARRVLDNNGYLKVSNATRETPKRQLAPAATPETPTIEEDSLQQKSATIEPPQTQSQKSESTPNSVKTPHEDPTDIAVGSTEGSTDKEKQASTTRKKKKRSLLKNGYLNLISDRQLGILFIVFAILTVSGVVFWGHHRRKQGRRKKYRNLNNNITGAEDGDPRPQLMVAEPDPPSLWSRLLSLINFSSLLKKTSKDLTPPPSPLGDSNAVYERARRSQPHNRPPSLMDAEQWDEKIPTEKRVEISRDGISGIRPLSKKSDLKKN